MTGLISLTCDPSTVEPVAANEAYTKWLRGFSVDQDLRFFTITKDLVTFCRGRYDSEWELVEEFDAMAQAEQVAAYLQGEYDGVEEQ